MKDLLLASVIILTPSKIFFPIATILVATQSSRNDITLSNYLPVLMYLTDLGSCTIRKVGRYGTYFLLVVSSPWMCPRPRKIWCDRQTPISPISKKKYYWCVPYLRKYSYLRSIKISIWCSDLRDLLKKGRKRRGESGDENEEVEEVDGGGGRSKRRHEAASGADNGDISRWAPLIVKASYWVGDPDLAVSFLPFYRFGFWSGSLSGFQKFYKAQCLVPMYIFTF